MHKVHVSILLKSFAGILKPNWLEGRSIDFDWVAIYLSQLKFCSRNKCPFVTYLVMRRARPGHTCSLVVMQNFSITRVVLLIGAESNNQLHLAETVIWCATNRSNKMVRRCGKLALVEWSRAVPWSVLHTKVICNETRLWINNLISIGSRDCDLLRILNIVRSDNLWVVYANH